MVLNMKKVSILVILLTIFISMFTIYPAAAANSISFGGTTTTFPRGLAKINVIVNGENLDNVSGQINYSTSDLVVFGITQNNSLSGWSVNHDQSNPGVITFNASSSSNKINSSTTLFTITFVVHNETAETTSVTATKVKTVITKKEEYISNQEAIDRAKEDKANAIDEETANKITIPDPVKATREIKSDVTIDDAKYDIKITEKTSDNAFLKSAIIINGTLNPTFNKLTNSYKVTIDDSISEIKTDMVPEVPTSTVEVSEETNNQIVVTVTSDKGTVNSYVFSIQRAHNYSPNIPGTNSGNPRKTSPLTLALLFGLGFVSIGFIGLGAYYVYVGSRED